MKKNIAIVIISVILSTTISFFMIDADSPTPAKPIDKKKTRISKHFFSGDEVIADIVEEITPSVVHITTEVEHKIVKDPRQFFFEDEFFRHFFGFENYEPRRSPITRKTSGTGSGVIITDDGYILTNYHVVQNASKILVKTKDNKQYPAKLAGKDKYSDLAVIKINKKGLQPAKLSDSSKIRPGQWAIAVGSPQGLDHTVTLGIISAVSRSIPELSNVNFIQTDAAINPGNSGGPLLNVKGEVVGINTAILGRAQNIGFAIPVNVAKNIVEKLKSGQAIGHPWLGIGMSPMTDELAKALGVPADTKGIVITKVMRSSPAARGGLVPGDIIQRMDGKKYDSPKTIKEAVKNKKVNDTINLQILREGQIMAKKIKLGNWGETVE